MSPARTAVLAVWLLGLAACALGLARYLSVNTELTVFLPPSSTSTQRLLIGQLRDGATSRMMLVALSGGTVPELARASRDLSRRLRDSGHFSFVSNGDPAAFRQDRDILLANRYLLSPAVSPERFSARGLQAALDDRLALLASPAGVLLKGTIPLDPTGELQELAQLLAPRDGPSLRDGVWFSRDASRALMVAQTRAPAFDVEAQQHALVAVQEAFAESLAGKGRIELSGPGVFASQTRDTIRAESWQMSLAASLLVLGILAMTYRSPAAVAACFLPVATGLLVGLAAVALGFGSVHGLTLAFGATLIGETVDYPSYLFAQSAPNEALPRTVSRIGPTLRLGVGTTILGALAMMLSSFEGLAQLGVLTAAGVMAAGATTVWVLPNLVPARALHRKSLGVKLDWLPGPALRLGRWPAVALIAVALLFVVSRHERLWDDDLANLTPVPESAKALDRRLREELGAPDVRYLLLAQGSDRESALQRSESLAAWLREAAASERIAGFEVPSAYLPSKRTQQARREALPDAPTLALNLETVIAKSAFRPGIFAPFQESVERAREGPLLELESLHGSVLGLKVSSMLVANQDGWTALAPLRGVASPAELARQAGQAGFQFLDLKAESNRLVNRYREESLRLFGLGLLCMAVLLAFSLRSVARAARVLAPVAAAAVVDLALLLALGRALSLFNLVALLLVIGIGLNYALFFERAQSDPAERARTRLSVLVCAATTLSVFGCLALSNTPVLESIGETVFFGCLLSMLFSVAFARGREPRQA